MIEVKPDIISFIELGMSFGDFDIGCLFWRSNNGPFFQSTSKV